ncbi:MAG TPA: NAD(P)H-binding protein [Pedococcus sp.]|jgi:nucleoside-diphosphate-sugar epimerase|nr:NAD(P)H-binding protein [Pedococcus sp.]
MIVVIAGGHGQIALRLAKELSDRGHEPIGLLRNPDQVPDLERNGARGEVLDLEHTTVDELSAIVAGADVVVFAAGAGRGSGAARKETVDRAGAVLLADAAQQAGVRRYVMVSAMGAEDADPASDEVFQVYLRAKAAADADLRARDLDWTIVRPGSLTDDAPTGKVDLGPGRPRGTVSRADVATVLAEMITTRSGIRKQVDLVSGRVPVAEAVAAVKD